MKACGFGWSALPAGKGLQHFEGSQLPKKRVTETQSSSTAGRGSEDDEGLQLITARDGPKSCSMMEMWLDSFACSSYCGVDLTESSACQPQSIMCSPPSDAEAGDSLRGELPAR